MGWLPTARVEVVKLAVVVPALVLKVPWPMLREPSEKITTPVGLATAGLPGPLTVTVAVKVTNWPDTVGLAEAATAVVVAAWLTVWVSVPLLVVKVVSPP